MADTTKPKSGAISDDAKKRLKESFKGYIKSTFGGGGSGSYWNGLTALDAAMKGGKGGGKKPQIEDPPLPPTDGNGDGSGDGSGGGTTSTLTKPKSNNWPDIVSFYFPEGARTQYKAGGLVRGGGAATKGRGRGRIV